MFHYYIKLAFLSLRKTPLLSLLMVLMIAVGIAAAMTMYTIHYMMAKDPIPNKSSQLFIVQIDSVGITNDGRQEDDDIMPWVTYQDVKNIQNSTIPKNSSPISALIEVISNPNKSDITPISTKIRTSSSDFFTMFDVPFQYGHAWSKDDDNDAAQVAVISQKMNQRLFNGKDSVGKTINFGQNVFKVVGVVADWRPIPKFYEYSNTAFTDPYDVFIPFNTQIKNEWFTSSVVSTYCWQATPDDSFESFLASECMWLYYWVELPSVQAQQDYKQYIDNYTKEQQSFGRFNRRIYNRLQDVNSYLNQLEVVPKDSKMAMWLAFLFLLVCLINCMSLMMAKFHGKATEIGLRRAVGASKQHIMAQFFVELAVLGGLGGILGFALTQLGLSVSKNVYSYLSTNLMVMDTTLTLLTFALSLIVSVLFGLYPAFKASQTQPSSQLKSL